MIDRNKETVKSLSDEISQYLKDLAGSSGVDRSDFDIACRVAMRMFFAESEAIEREHKSKAGRR